MSGNISELEGISTYPGFGPDNPALMAEIEYLRKELQELREEFKGLQTLRREFDEYQEWAAKERAEDRRELYKLSGDREPGDTCLGRVTRLEHYMRARPDHKASYESIKGFLEITDVQLNQVIKVFLETKEGYAVTKDARDKRKRWLIQLPVIARNG